MFIFGIGIDKMAIRFDDGKTYGINAFWKDLFGRRGFKFFFYQLYRGLKCIHLGLSRYQTKAMIYGGDQLNWQSTSLTSRRLQVRVLHRPPKREKTKMSHRVGNVVIIETEPDQQCDFCGKIAELRPYGPEGEYICYACSMKDQEITYKMMGKVLFGD